MKLSTSILIAVVLLITAVIDKILMSNDKQNTKKATLRDIWCSLFQPLKDKNTCQPVPKVLKDIVESLETMPGTGSMEV